MFIFLLPMSYELVEKISPNPNGESSELGIVVAKMVAGPSPRVLAAAWPRRECARISHGKIAELNLIGAWNLTTTPGAVQCVY